MSVDRCASCDLELPPDEPGSARTPCPRCGATARIISASAHVAGKATISARGSVERGVNEARMAGFALIFATGVGSGLALGLAGSSVLLGVLGGFLAAMLTTLALASIYRVRVIRHGVMEFMHRVTRQ